MISTDMKTIALDSDRKTSLFNDRYIWILLIISLSVRIYLSFFTYVIQNDSVAFMQNARYFADGDFLSGLRHDYHPLYSFLMAVMYKVIPDMEISGTIVSVSFGTLTVIVFYLIGKSVFDRKISFVSSVILALHPYVVRFSVDIISESTYFFFFISALGFGFFAITKKRPVLFALTGICAAFAYLTRPEGIGIIIIVASWCALKDCVNIKVLWKEKLVSILVLVVSFFVFSMPYLIYIKNETGDWRLTKKKTLTTMAGVGGVLIDQNNDSLAEEDGDKKKSLSRNIIKQATAKKSDFNKHISSILHIVKKYIFTFHPLLFMLFIIGVINWSKIRKERLFGFYIITVTAFYVFILYRLSITYLAGYDGVFIYPSRRHLMPLVIPAVFCVGIGVYTAGAWIHEKFHNCSLIVGFKELLKSTWSIQLIVLIMVIGILLPKTLKPQRSDKLGIKVVGQWVKEHSHKPYPVILSTSGRSAYYAGGKHVQMERINGALVLAREKNVDYILITQKEYMALEEDLLRSKKGRKIALAYKYPETKSLNRHSVLLYEVLY